MRMSFFIHLLDVLCYSYLYSPSAFYHYSIYAYTYIYATFALVFSRIHTLSLFSKLTFFSFLFFFVFFLSHVSKSLFLPFMLITRIITYLLSFSLSLSFSLYSHAYISTPQIIKSFFLSPSHIPHLISLSMTSFPYLIIQVL